MCTLISRNFPEIAVNAAHLFATFDVVETVQPVSDQPQLFARLGHSIELIDLYSLTVDCLLFASANVIEIVDVIIRSNSIIVYL